MRTPFDIHAEDIATIFGRRLRRVREDRLLAESSELVLVLDAFFLYCLFLEDLESDINGWFARHIYTKTFFRFAVVPETLWEIQQVLDESMSALVAKGDISELRNFLQLEDIKSFMSMMEHEDSRDWDEILRLVVRLTSNDRTRSGVMALFRYETVRRFERPLEQMSSDIEGGYIVRLSELCGMFGATELGLDERDKRSAYALLSAYRAKGRSDLIDAMVFARCSHLNSLAIQGRIGNRCRFLSHETMIEMLSTVEDTPGRATLVRSLTDLSITAGIVEGRITSSEVEKTESLARDVNRLEKGAFTGERLKKAQQLRADLRDLKERVSSGAPEANFASFHFLDLARERIQRFFATILSLQADDLSFGDRHEKHEKQVMELYRALYNFREQQGGLADFMRPILEQSRRMGGGNIVEEKENMLFWTTYLFECADEADIPEILMELIASGCSITRASEKTQSQLNSAALDRLPVLVKFLQEIDKMRAYSRRTEQPDEVRREILQHLRRRANEEIPIGSDVNSATLLRRLRDVNIEDLYDFALEEASNLVTHLKSTDHKEFFAKFILAVEQLKRRS